MKRVLPRVGRRVLAAAVLALLLTGCRGVLRPDPDLSAIQILARLESRPKVKLPDVLTMAEAKKIALAQNPDLRAAQERVVQAEARLRQARSLYFPTLSAGAAGIYTRYQPHLEIPGGADQDYWTYSAGVDVYWILCNGLSREFNALAARHGRDAGIAAQHDVQRLLVNGVANAFLATLLQQSLMQTAEADAAYNKQLLEETLKRVKVEKASRADELNFRIAYNQARVNYLTARQNYRLARMGLAQLLGLSDAELPESTRLELPTLPNPVPAVDLTAAIDQALRRPDMMVLANQVEATRAAARARFGELFPSLALTGQYGAVRLNNMRFDDDDMNANVGAVVEWDLDLGGAKRNAWREAAAARRESEALLESRRNALVNELRSLIERLEASEERLRLQQESVALAQEQRDLIEKSWRAGRDSITRLNEVQAGLIGTQATLSVYQAQLLTAIEDLLAATGQNLPAAK